MSYLALSTDTASPFSIIDFNLGTGGTFATQALYLTPPTVTVQVPHSPFLQLKGTLSPNLEQA